MLTSQVLLQFQNGKMRFFEVLSIISPENNMDKYILIKEEIGSHEALKKHILK